MMDSKNYFIKNGYIPNLIQATYDTDENDVFWDENRIKNSATLQYYVYDTCRKMIKKKSFVKVMDVGCGPPVKIKQMFDLLRVKLTLVDQPSVAKFARNLLPEASFIESNLEVIETDLDEIFDLIICCDVVEHLINPDRCIDFIRNHLAENGLAVFSTPERDYRRGISCNACTKKEHVREWNQAEFAMYLKSRGFNIISHKLFPQARTSMFEFYLSRILKNIIEKPRWYSCQMAVCSATMQ